MKDVTVTNMIATSVLSHYDGLIHEAILHPDSNVVKNDKYAYELFIKRCIAYTLEHELEHYVEA